MTRAPLLALALLPGCMLIDSLIFFPDPTVPDPPPGVEERWITTEDGVKLHAWYARGAADGPTLLWSHGNGGNIANREGPILALARRGLGVFAYDYRGYGRSEGRPSVEGIGRDARAAYEGLRTAGIPAGRILCFGESLGGAVAIGLAAERPCAAVAVVSTFTRLRDVGRYHYGPLAAFAGSRLDSLARLSDLQVPLFVAHGDRDEIVPYELGEALFAAAHEPKRFFRAPGYHHNDIFDCVPLLDAIAAFARESAALD